MEAHPKKEIRKAIKEATDEGWTIERRTGRGHTWGILHCPADDPGCKISVWGTPRNEGNHAKQIRKSVTRCPHEEEEK